MSEEAYLVHLGPIAVCNNADYVTPYIHQIEIHAPHDSLNFSDDYVTNIRLLNLVNNSSSEESIYVDKISDTEAAGTSPWGQSYAQNISYLAECLHRVESSITIDDLLNIQNNVEDPQGPESDIFLHEKNLMDAMVHYQELCFCITKNKLSPEEMKKLQETIQFRKEVPELIEKSLAGGQIKSTSELIEEMSKTVYTKD